MAANSPVVVNNPQTFDTFLPFDRLATENKLKIWGFAANEPRIVTIYHHRGGSVFHCCDKIQWFIYMTLESGAKYPGRKLIYINPAVDKFLFECRLYKESYMWPEYMIGYPYGLPLSRLNLEPHIIRKCKHLVLRAEVDDMEEAIERAKCLLAVKRLKDVTMIVEDNYALSIGGKDLEETDLRKLIEGENKGLQTEFIWVSEA
ncbi:uncharacterized protein PAC_12421 [Phialocephala subalpina]|uniref:Uncharacterized protein n=1 Tax=Phialocephala subalpina TaxID=576137 RepID=A0A1L7XBW3_9HELO|nr:uncharacterized protein PAC_12421 [Phialocephala subalpina]